VFEVSEKVELSTGRCHLIDSPDFWRSLASIKLDLHEGFLCAWMCVRYQRKVKNRFYFLRDQDLLGSNRNLTDEISRVSVSSIFFFNFFN